jgi:hypothetical protein
MYRAAESSLEYNSRDETGRPYGQEGGIATKWHMEAVRALDEITEMLVRDGWDYVDRYSDRFWCLRFRRPAD